MKGQSTIEFLLSLAFSLSFLFLFIMLGFNYTSGSLVHLATFLSARHYLVYDDHQFSVDPDDSDPGAINSATNVFNQFNLEAFGVNKVPARCPIFNRAGVSKYEYVGAICEWEATLNVMGIVGANQRVHLISEAFLGREPTTADCSYNICQVIYTNGSCDVDFITLFDDGC